MLDPEDYEAHVDSLGGTNQISSEVPAHSLHEFEAVLALLVGKYKSFTKLAAEQIVRKAAIVVEAETTLSADAIDRFCKQVGLKRKSSTFRKYRKIGQQADRLLAVADRLPDNWTTLYRLASLDNEEFDNLVTSEVLQPGITASDLVGSGCASADEKCVLSMDVTELPDGQRVEAFRELEDVAAKYGVTVTGLPDELVASLDTEVA